MASCALKLYLLSNNYNYMCRDNLSRLSAVLPFEEIDLKVLQEIGQEGHEYAASHGRELRKVMGADDDEEDEDMQ